MRVWVTRAEPGAAATAGVLRRLGHDPFVWPLLAVRPLDAAIDLAGVAALAFTSANGVRAFADSHAGRDLPVFTVGDATAAAALAAGFLVVESAGGDVGALADLIADRRPGPVLHLGAREPAGDLAGDLASRGLPARAAAVYETIPRTPPADLPPLDAVLLHSPRAARLLARLTVARRLLAVCISPAAAAPLAAQGFPDIATAAFPTEAAMLKLLAEPTREGA